MSYDRMDLTKTAPNGLTYEDVVKKSTMMEDYENMTLYTSGITLSGHSITANESFDEFTCRKCDKTYEVPDIFIESGGSNAVLYQLFIYGKFATTTCPEIHTPGIGNAIPDGTNNTPISSPHDRYYLSSGVGIDHYTDSGGENYWKLQTGDSLMSTEEVLKSLPPEERENFVAETGLPGVAKKWSEII